MTRAGVPWHKWQRFYQTDMKPFHKSEWDESSRRTIALLTHNPAPPRKRKRRSKRKRQEQRESYCKRCLRKRRRKRKRKGKRKRQEQRESYCKRCFPSHAVIKTMMSSHSPTELFSELIDLREAMTSICENVDDCANELAAMNFLNNCSSSQEQQLARMPQVLMFTSSEAMRVKMRLDTLTCKHKLDYDLPCTCRPQYGPQ